jgi:hypothetical protein
MQVSKCFEGSLDPNNRYIFAYMPHGMLPAGAIYMPFLPSWREQFPGVEPVGLTASVIHVIPFLRDAIQLLGGRVVRICSCVWDACTLSLCCQQLLCFRAQT